jgi:hypothetical protein
MSMHAACHAAVPAALRRGAGPAGAGAGDSPAGDCDTAAQSKSLLVPSPGQQIPSATCYRLWFTYLAVQTHTGSTTVQAPKWHR